MAPRSLLVRRRAAANSATNNTTTKDNDELETLLRQMEEHMALDRLLEARSVVDQIQREVKQQNQSYNNTIISPERQRLMDHIIQESDHIQEMLHDLHSSEGWTLSNRRKGVDVYYRQVPDSQIHAVKTYTTLEDISIQDFVHLCSLFFEGDLMPEWFPNNFMDSLELLAEPSKYRQIFRCILKFHFLPISDRELIAEGVGYDLRDQNAYLGFTKSIESSEYCDIPPPKRRPVRMESRMVFHFQLLPNERKVKYCQISHDNMHLRFVPAFVINYIAQGIVPAEFISAISRILQNYEGTEWERRLKNERRDFYKEIEERLLADQKIAGYDVSRDHTSKQNGACRALVEKNKATTVVRRKPRGMPLWKAVVTMVLLVGVMRASLVRTQLPRSAYMAILVISAAFLTRLAFLSQKGTNK
jgi:hypothetical protein